MTTMQFLGRCDCRQHIFLQLPMIDRDLFTIWLAKEVKHFTSILDLINLEPVIYQSQLFIKDDCFQMIGGIKRRDKKNEKQGAARRRKS
uniref:Uncharacterized protein n=1 Tax=Romanomermis culicivorax TaxID=13658 RepID=A0A915JSC8_ROMCU